MISGCALVVALCITRQTACWLFCRLHYVKGGFYYMKEGVHFLLVQE